MQAEWFAAQIQALRVLPMVVLDHPTSGVGVAHALASGGLTCMEITLRTEGAIEAITAVTEAVPDMLVGAGTVMRAQQVDAAVAAGAHFVASPVVDHGVIRRARERGVSMLPGVASHAEAIAAARAGARTVKLHLPGGADGLGELRTYSKLFRALQFIPTGALEAAEVAAYLREPRVLAVGTSRITPYGAGGDQVRRLATEFAVS